MRGLLKIFLGNMLLGFAYAKLMVPHEIINGGVTSLALILNSFFHLSVPLFTNTLTISLLIIGLLFLGKYFFFSSLVSSFSYLLFFNLFYNWDFSIQINFVADFILAVLLIATGYYCCLSEDSSTAGLDVFAVIFNKRISSKIPVSTYLRYLNITVLILGYASYGLESIVVGIIFSICFTKVIDYFMYHRKKIIEIKNV